MQLKQAIQIVGTILIQTFNATWGSRFELKCESNQIFGK